MPSELSLQADFRLGFLGAGQLARMSALEAFRYGIQVGVFSDRSETEPVEFMTPFSTVGDYNNVSDMVAFAKTCDIVTLENEFIPSKVLKETQYQSGTPIYPSPSTFSKIENKLVEKQTFEAAGIPVTPYLLIESSDDLQSFGEEHGWPYVLKSSKGGYDGYGNETVRDFDDAIEAFKNLGGDKGHDLVAEAFIDFEKELAVQVARNTTGHVVYPCCETIQENHINTAVVSPARIPENIQHRAQELAVTAMEAIDAKGMFAFEFFLTPDGNLLLNESAPRPHNSGHYTIEGCITSQFENHVRAVLDLPLGSAKMRKPAVVMINLLGTQNRPAQMDHLRAGLEDADGHLHIYGKRDSRIGRKMGHFTFLGEDVEATYTKAKQLTDEIEI